jgi:hypothetical protein
MKQTYFGRTPILTLFTFFALVLGSQWTFGQTQIDKATSTDVSAWNDGDHTISSDGTKYNVTNTSTKKLETHRKKFWNSGSR